MLRYLSPSVVDISGAGMKYTIVSEDKKKKPKMKQSTEISNTLTVILPSVVVISGAEIKRTIVIKKRLTHKNKTKYYILK